MARALAAVRRLCVTLLLLVPLFATGPGAARAEDARGLQLGGQAFQDGAIGRRLALCVGINGYAHEHYGPLKYATADARALAGTFDALGYEVTLAVDDDPDLPPELVPTYRNLDDLIHAFCKRSRSENDTLVIAFSGHGDVVDGQSALLPVDYHEAERALTMGTLFDSLKRSRAAKKLLVLDACRSGRRDAARTMQSGFLESLGRAQDAVVISGCGADQFSYEEDALGQGRLTKTLVDGLAGAAFGEGREFLFGHELWGYIEQVFHDREWAAQQSPTMFGVWDARVRFDVARRDVAPPPPLTDTDRAVVQSMLEMGLAVLATGDATKCIEYAGTALRIVPTHADALALKGTAYMELGYVDKAFEYAQASLEQEPGNVFALVVLCYCDVRRGDVELMIKDATRAALLFGLDTDRWTKRLPRLLAANMWLAYGTGMFILGSTRDKLLAAFGEVLAIEEASPWAVAWARMYRGHVLLLYGEAREAMLEIERAIEVAATVPDGDLQAWCLHHRALGWEVQSRLDEAVRDYTAALESEGALPGVIGEALIRRGAIQEGRGQRPEAMVGYRRVLGMAEAFPNAKALAALRLGRDHASRGETTEALALFTRAVEQAGASPDTRAWSLSERGREHRVYGHHEESAADLEQAVAIRLAQSWARAYAYNQYAWTLEGLDRTDEALAARRAVRDVPGAPLHEVAWSRVNEAAHLQRLGRGAEARPLLETVLASDGPDPHTRVMAFGVRALIHAEGGAAEASAGDIASAYAVEGAGPLQLAFVWMAEVRANAALRGADPSLQAPPAGPPALDEAIGEVWREALRHVALGDWPACDAHIAQALETQEVPWPARWAVTECGGWGGLPPESRVLEAWLQHDGAHADGARRALTRYLEAHPDGALAKRARTILASLDGD